MAITRTMTVGDYYLRHQALSGAFSAVTERLHAVGYEHVEAAGLLAAQKIIVELEQAESDAMSQLVAASAAEPVAVGDAQ